MALIYILLVWIFGASAPGILRKNLNTRTGSNNFTYSRLHEVKNIASIDILFLGSSHAYRGFDTRIFEKHGLITFNLGSSNQTPVQTELLIKRYLDRINTKTIVYEVYAETFTIDGVESAVDIIANDKNDYSSVKMALLLNNMKVYNTLLCAFLNELFNFNSSFTEPEQSGDDTYISGGYVEKKISYFKYVDYPVKKWKFYEDQIVTFGKVVELIKKKNVNLILVNAPVTSSLYRSYSNNASFDSLMMKYGLYYNFNELIQLDDSLDFNDSEHLNQTGVEKFDKKLLETALSGN